MGSEDNIIKVHYNVLCMDVSLHGHYLTNPGHERDTGAVRGGHRSEGGTSVKFRCMRTETPQ